MCVFGLPSTSVPKLRGLPMNGAMAASSHRIMLGPLVAAIDQGTSSTRFLVRAAPGCSKLRLGRLSLKAASEISVFLAGIFALIFNLRRVP